jgi:hypothetical protein
MPSFRLVDKTRTFFGLQAQLLAGGSLVFYQAGTTTLQDVYGDKDLSVNNGNTVDLDSSGRPSVDVWADTTDTYFMEVYDSAGVKQGELDNMEVPGGAGQTIPTLDPGEYLSGDGTNFIAVSLDGKLLPDMAGNANKILGTDGSVASWVAKPADGAAGVSDIVIASGSVKWSNGSNHILKQWGSDTATNTNTRDCTKAITFATAYSATPKIQITPAASAAPTVGGNVFPKFDIIAKSTTGFTVKFSTWTGGTSADASSTNNVINADIPFDWEAIGTTAS